MLKENWIPRIIVSIFITVIGLGGWVSMNNVSFDTYIPIALVWFIIVYFLSGFFFNFKKKLIINLILLLHLDSL